MITMSSEWADFFDSLLLLHGVPVLFHPYDCLRCQKRFERNERIAVEIHAFKDFIFKFRGRFNRF